MSGPVDEARRRHPSAQWHADHGRLRRMLAAELRQEGHPRPTLGSAVLAVRGLLGLDRAGLAGRLGLSEGDVATLEDGHDRGAGVPNEPACEPDKPLNPAG